LVASACSAAGTNQSVPPTYVGANAGTVLNQQAQPAVDLTSVLKLLTKQTVIGSTVDPVNGDQNPYGLIYVNAKPFGGGVIKKGDLVICNFNDKANVQGNGTTMEYMTSVPGSKPQRLLQNTKLKGCASLVINGFGQMFAANSGAKNVLGVSAKAKIFQTLTNKAMVEPWGTGYATGFGYPPGDAIFVSDASNGKIFRINLGTSNGQPTYTPVISGFDVNRGAPGSILGPSGVQYNQKADILYVVDGVDNTVVAFKHAYNTLNAANSVVVQPGGLTFKGPQAKNAALIFHGKPLNGPVSSTLLPNGNLVVGNTLNPKGTNLLVEIASNGKLLATKNVDKGAAGALFGIVATGSSDATTKIFFNDDNKNNVQMLSE
jgi:hypothetical protein